MRQPWIVCGLLISMFIGPSRLVVSQTKEPAAQAGEVAGPAAEAAAQSDPDATYSLRVSVDEVVLTFHVADARGLPINDLKASELTLLDNGKPPRKILDFQLQKDFPIRAGIFVDTSGSMRGRLSSDEVIAAKFGQQLLRQTSDKVFVMSFGRFSQYFQSWTSDATALSIGIGNINIGAKDSGGGTAIFDTLLRACFNQFGETNRTTSGNVILLFSDGEDNASYAYLKSAVDMCQRSNTAIYAFRVGSKGSFGSTGPETLAELTSETGGRVFEDDDSQAEIDNDLRTIEANVRDQYRLVYRPAELKHDGCFHRITLETPDRVGRVTIRSGYYAPAH
jgi:Ca-activated chloride channel family protein